MAISNAENENLILSGIRKSAIAIVALGDDVATEVFRLLTDEEVQRVSREISKLGTVTPDVGRAVGEQKSGKVEYRVDKNGIVHCSIGKRSFEAAQLLGNAAALIDAIAKAKPAASKGTYLQKVGLSTTMGPSLRVDPGSALALGAA